MASGATYMTGTTRPSLTPLLVAFGLALLSGAWGTPAGADGSWAYYGQGPGGARFSSLSQITRRNVRQLEVAWTWRHGELEGEPERKFFAGFHVTPILLPEEAGGHLAVCTPFGRAVALNPATGEEVWSYDAEISFAPYPTRLKCLGVAYWADTSGSGEETCAHRIFMGTSDRRLVALDSRSGQACEGFGEQGIVDVTPLIEASEPPPGDVWGVLFSAPPVLVGDVVVIGGINNMKNRLAAAPGGHVRGFDARTGALRWSFNPVPRDREPAPGDWTPEGLEITGGANVWSLMSVDQERDLVFLPTASASPNFYGGTRPGDNRYANSVVALKGSTGEVVWSFQTIHHDVWDWDVPAQPMLVDVRLNDEVVPAVVQLTKPGLVFVLNRETGSPLFPVEERPVPTDGVPGEVLSPTQPFPLRPPPLMDGNLTPDMAWGLTFWDRGQCRQMIENARHGPIFTPPSTDGWIMYPGTGGGLNWGGGAFDTERQLLVTTVQKIGMWLKLLPVDDVGRAEGFDPALGAPMGPPSDIRGTPYAIQQSIFLGPLGVPCTPPPWSTLIAVDLFKGDIAWEVPLGLVDKLAPVPLPIKMGTPTAGGPIITAGGLIFVGATGDQRFRAFELETGRELWSSPLPASANATPMTYQVDDRQYILTAAGGHMFINAKEINDYLVAFALPR